MIDRRRFLILAAAGCALAPETARATPDEMAAAMAAVVQGRPVSPGRVTLDLPALVENGNTVPMTVKVDSPMTATDHVRAIHVFNPLNPQPHVADFHLGPRNGRAQVGLHIKLATSQTVTALAELSDGSLWRADAEVIVTIAACIEEGP